MYYQPLVSIIINNFNYAQFLKEALDSALSQTYPHIEVIVVDDGSTDNSHGIITSYGDKIIPIIKENGGQASAINGGYKASSGEVICFLDSDDVFCSQKVSQIVDFFAQLKPHSDLLLFHEQEVIDKNSNSLGRNLKLLCELPELNYQRSINQNSNRGLRKICDYQEVYKYAKRYRHIPYLATTTSGLSLSRSLADKIFPIPEGNIKNSADVFIVKGAAILGEIYASKLVLGKYRIHGINSWYGTKVIHRADFFHTVDNFLNFKLKSTERQPIVSYFNSFRSKAYYKYDDKDFDYIVKSLQVAIKSIVYHTDIKTIKFFTKTIIEALAFLPSALQIKLLSNEQKD